MKTTAPTLAEIAGYTCERAVWRLIAALTAAGACPAPERIAADGDRWLVGAGGIAPQFRAPEGDSLAWAVGAAAFYALMGVAVFDGRGGAVQQPSTPLPRIGAAHCSAALSDLIARCLDHDPGRRPSPADIARAAAGAIDAPATPPRRLSHPAGRSYARSMVAFWPDEMVPLIVAAILMLCPATAAARTVEVPGQMLSLVERCTRLRSQGEAARVSREFMRDPSWTLMDELAVDRRGECTVKDKVETLGFNEMGFRIARLHAGVTTHSGRFRNGADPRYSYSLIEVTVKRGATVSYDIPGRAGRQIFAIVSREADASFTASLTADGSAADLTRGDDAVCWLDLDADITPDSELRLSITNTSGHNLALVLINYNSRR